MVRRVGKWFHHMGQVYRQWAHKVDYTYHVLGLRHPLITNNLQRQRDTHPDEMRTYPRVKHGQAGHRSIQCLKWGLEFKRALTQLRGPWAQYAEDWCAKATPEDLLHRVACPRILHQFYDQVLEGEGLRIRA